MADTPTLPAEVMHSRRRQYVTHSAFQWKYSLTAAIAVLVVASILSSVQFGMLHQQARLRAANPESYFANVSTIIFLFGLGFAALTALGVCVWSIVVTHRICGPLLILEKYLGELGENRIPNIRPLRKKDEFKELFTTLSTSMGKLRLQRSQEKKSIVAIMQKLEAVATSCDEQRRPNLEKAMEDLNQLCHDINSSLGEDCMADMSERSINLTSNEPAMAS